MSTIPLQTENARKEFSLSEEIARTINKNGLTIPKTDAAVNMLSDATYSELTPIPALSLQFLISVDEIKSPSCLAKNDFIPFFFEDNLMALTYKGFEVFIRHKRLQKSCAGRAIKAWERSFDSAVEADWKNRQAVFLNGGGSIYNIFLESNDDLKKKAETINALMKEHEGAELFILTHLSREGFKSDALIRDYIIEVFSIIEFIGCSLLPFWECANTKEWNHFLNRCAKNNPNIEQWIDLYDEKKTAYKVTTITENGMPKEIRTPIPINIIDIFFKTLRDYDAELSDTYFSLKKRYRNTLSHGMFNSLFNFGIVPSAPNVYTNSSVEDIINGYDESCYYDALLNVDFHAFLLVEAFFRRFLEFIERNYPAYYLILTESRVIPLGIDLRLFSSLTDPEVAHKWLAMVDIENQILIPYKYWDLLHEKDIELDENLKKLLDLVDGDKELLLMSGQELWEDKQAELLGLVKTSSADDIPESMVEALKEHLAKEYGEKNVRLETFHTKCKFMFTITNVNNPDSKILSGNVFEELELLDQYIDNEEYKITFSQVETYTDIPYDLACSEIMDSWYSLSDSFYFDDDPDNIFIARRFIEAMAERRLGVHDITFTEKYRSEIDKLFDSCRNETVIPFCKIHRMRNQEVARFVKKNSLAQEYELEKRGFIKAFI